MEIQPIATQFVGDLVAEDSRRAAVFKRFGIDFCCGGCVTLEVACQAEGLDLAEVEEALATADVGEAAPPPRVASWSPAFLADYVVNEHHSYVRQSVPVLRVLTEKVARVHGASHPELVEIAALFSEAATGLETHLASEEDVVFPRIKALADGRTSDGPPLRDLVGDMESEHDHAGALFRQIRRLSADYSVPDDACASYHALYAELEAFEDDLHRHVHIENHVLFPKALALEAPAPSPIPMSEKTLDVRPIPPAQKHATIFATFDALAPGDHFVLVNDHDPVPLKHQFDFVRKGQVGWEYVEKGPEVWRVQISRLGDQAVAA